VFRWNKIAFYKNGVEESDSPPPLQGDQVWDRVSKFPKTIDNCVKLVMYLNVMHIEKNVCEQIIHITMDVKGKTKNDVNARRDLAEHSKR